MTGELTLGRRRADDARHEIATAIYYATRGDSDPADALRSVVAAALRATAHLEEADRLLASGIPEAVAKDHLIRDLEVQLAYRAGGTEAANALIERRYAPRSRTPVPSDEPDDSDLPEPLSREDRVLALANVAIDHAGINEDDAHDFADAMLSLIEMPGATTEGGAA